MRNFGKLQPVDDGTALGDTCTLVRVALDGALVVQVHTPEVLGELVRHAHLFSFFVCVIPIFPFLI